MSSERLILTVGAERFSARLRRDLAPRSCECLLGLLPYMGKLIHARWSGEALWSSLAEILPPDFRLPPESATESPAPGQLLLYAGELSVPELLIPYGTSRFACKAGALQGNPVLSVEDRLDRLSSLGPEVLWKGARELRIEVSP